ncbi:MAG: type VI secretion system protein TssA [Acidobacteriota bacterium]
MDPSALILANMANTDPVIDIEGLLTPVSGDNPSGENLQYVGVHDEIREARRADDPAAVGDWQGEFKTADWPAVIQLSTEALKDRTKDLQIGAWLCEALVKENGFRGLRDGLRLLRGLHENFWDTLYPEIDEGDLEARANCLALMDRQASLAVKEIELTAVRGDENFSWLRWEKTRLPDEINKIAQADRSEADRIRAETEKAGEDWARLFRSTPRRFYEELDGLLAACWEEFKGLDKVMDDRFGRQTPGLGELKRSLEDLRSLSDKLVKEKRIAEPDPVTEEEAAGEGPGEGAGAATGGGFMSASGVIRGRQDALRRLAEIADYFQKTEPHSPVSYLVQRAVKWGAMPLEQWLQEVIKDSTTLGYVQETLGLKVEGEGG